MLRVFFSRTSLVSETERVFFSRTSLGVRKRIESFFTCHTNRRQQMKLREIRERIGRSLVEDEVDVELERAFINEQIPEDLPEWYITEAMINCVDNGQSLAVAQVIEEMRRIHAQCEVKAIFKYVGNVDTFLTHCLKLVPSTSERSAT